MKRRKLSCSKLADCNHIMAGKRLELEFFNPHTNQTVVFRGTVGVNSISMNDTAFNQSEQENHVNYDSLGALWFVVTVILVYSLSMFMIVITFTRHKSENKRKDIEVASYLKGLEGARRQAREEQVLRMRLRWPGNWISLRFSRHPNRNYAASTHRVTLNTDGATGEELPGSQADLPPITADTANEVLSTLLTVEANHGSRSSVRQPGSVYPVSSRRGAAFVNREDLILPCAGQTCPMKTIRETSAANKIDCDDFPESSREHVNEKLVPAEEAVQSSNGCQVATVNAATKRMYRNSRETFVSTDCILSQNEGEHKNLDVPSGCNVPGVLKNAHHSDGGSGRQLFCFRETRGCGC